MDDFIHKKTDDSYIRIHHEKKDSDDYVYCTSYVYYDKEAAIGERLFGNECEKAISINGRMLYPRIKIEDFDDEILEYLIEEIIQNDTIIIFY